MLNVSDQADVNALVVHWSTRWSIAGTFEFEEANANADRKERRRAQQRSMLAVGAGKKKG